MDPQSPPSNPISRRRLLKLGVATTAVLAALAASTVWKGRPISQDGKLGPDARGLLQAVALAVLEGSLQPAPAERAAQLEAHLGRIESVLRQFPPATRSEFESLITVLSLPPTRRAITTLRKPWQEASLDETSAALEDMRTSSLSLKQQAYHALRDLTNAAFYADPTAWPLMGYPGPTSI